MPANDTSDPLIVELLDRCDEYRRLYDFGSRKFNRDEVLHLYKKDEDFTAYDVAPPQGGYIGWKAYSGVGWYGVMDKYAEIHFKYMDDLRVYRRGEVGWSSVSSIWGGKTTRGADFAKDCRITLVWVRENDQWVITQEHASSPRLFDLPTGEKV